MKAEHKISGPEITEYKTTEPEISTPLVDFVKAYQASATSRLHMPGHKGKGLLGFEPWDITEIKGADELYEAEGIIAESEENARRLFGTGATLYSTEGSSQCIRAMLHLVLTHIPDQSDRTILAARNVHKAFVYSAALLDFTPEWLWPEESSSLCSCQITAGQLEEVLKARVNQGRKLPAAVYVTSPDYLGYCSDIEGLAEVCHAFGTRLVVDNAHGAYLHYLEPSGHPIALGADMCCDSAHKTLPVVTGGAYLHLSEEMAAVVGRDGKRAMALFGSTSPSYLILASLDACNGYLAGEYSDRLEAFCESLAQVRDSLRSRGMTVYETDPLRLTLHGPSVAATGFQLADRLRQAGGECEYADRDDLVLMLTPENREEDLMVILEAFSEAYIKTVKMESGEKTDADAPGKGNLPLARGQARLSVRQAIWAPQERIPVEESLDRICGCPAVSCPPAIPVVVSGEVITKEAIEIFHYYGIDYVDVVAQ